MRTCLHIFDVRVVRVVRVGRVVRVVRVVHVVRVVRVVRARQLPSPGPRAPQVVFTLGEAQVQEGGEGRWGLGGP